MRAIGAQSAAAEVGGTEKAVAGLGHTAKQVAGAAGLAALAFGLKDVIGAAINFQQMQVQLGNALSNTGQYTKGAVDQLSQFSDTLSTHGGFDPSQTLSGISRLVRAHDNVAQAMRDETLATDIARGSKISYDQAVRVVTMAELGHASGLTRLGLSITPVTKATDALSMAHQSAANRMAMATADGVKFTAQQKAQFAINNQITPQMREQAKLQDQHATGLELLTTLTHKYGGATEDYARTAAGAFSDFKDQVDVLAQRLGVILLPAVTTLVGALNTVLGVFTSIVDFLEHHKTIFVLVASLLGGIAIAIWGVTAAVVAWNLAMDAVILTLTILQAMPLILLISAIIFGLYELVTHWHDVKEAFIDAWHAIESVFISFWHTLQSVGNSIAHFFVGIWGAVKGAAVDAWSWVKHAATDAWTFLKGIGHDLLDAIEWPFKMAFKGILAIYDVTIKPILDTIKWFAGLFGGNVGGTAVSFNPHTIGQGVGVIAGHGTSIAPPGRATGGPINTGGIYRVGEQGIEDVYIPAGSYVQPTNHPAAGGAVPQEFQAKVPVEIPLHINGREFARAMQIATATVMATR